MGIEIGLDISSSENVFCSFERKDKIQNSNITFYYNRFPAKSIKSPARFRI